MPWRNPHAPPAQAPVNVPAVMESDFLLMKTLPLRNHRGQIAHVPAVVAAANALPVKVVDSRALLLPRPNPLPGPAAGVRATLRVPTARSQASTAGGPGRLARQLQAVGHSAGRAVGARRAPHENRLNHRPHQPSGTS